MDAARQTCRNCIFLAGTILGAPGKQQRSIMMLETVRPVWTGFTLEEKNLKSEQSVVQYHIGHCRGAYDIFHRRVVDVSRNTAKLSRIGFCTDFSQLQPPLNHIQTHGGKRKRKSASQAGAATRVSKEACDRHCLDMCLAAQQFSFQVALVRNRSLSELHCKHGLPERLAFLASVKPADIAEGLGIFARVWKVLEAARSKRHHLKQAEATLQTVWWCRNVSIREVLVTCGVCRVWVQVCTRICQEHCLHCASRFWQ